MDTLDTRGGSFCLWFLVVLLTCPHPTQAITILFTATDLLNTTPGEDRWQYTYTVSDFPFPASFGFDIFFRLADGYQFGDLDTTPLPPNADWDILVLQPDPGLPVDGRYEAVTRVDAASLADPFTLGFIWRGSGMPGAQRFEVFDTNFDVVASGPTTSGQAAAVPEPATVVLLSTGLLSLAWWRTTRWTHRRSATVPAMHGR